MSDIIKPMSIPELMLRPDIGGKTRLSDDMQQTLATLVAYGDNARKLLKASESGILSVSSARIKDIVHFARDGVEETQKGSDLLLLPSPQSQWSRLHNTSVYVRSTNTLRQYRRR
ncbi:unnamed protein product [marine sediment metagenome]|uniref:Uncharacterized protein n=1 Tax=marine sediment metagenome TaxID=412755 RepID=X1R7I8_9ZZZZ